MKIKIDENIIKQFPDVKIGVLIAKGINNHQNHEEIAILMRKAEEYIRKQYTLNDITSILKIADWREAYRMFGCKPSEYRSSIEALIRRILQGKQLPSINPVVDIYNLISITYLLPAGGGNLDKIKDTINLTTAQGAERFIMLGHDSPTPVKPGEVIYTDNEEVICRAWNYRESDKTKITEDIKNVYLMIEGLQNTTTEEINSAIQEMTTMISLYCNGSFKTFMLDKENSEISF